MEMHGEIVRITFVCLAMPHIMGKKYTFYSKIDTFHSILLRRDVSSCVIDGHMRSGFHAGEFDMELKKNK
jgi:hypothetical protein